MATSGPLRVKVELDDGSLMVPAGMLEAIGEEVDASGGLTVARCQVLVEKWGKDQGERA